MYLNFYLLQILLDPTHYKVGAIEENHGPAMNDPFKKSLENVCLSTSLFDDDGELENSCINLVALHDIDVPPNSRGVELLGAYGPEVNLFYITLNI